MKHRLLKAGVILFIAVTVVTAIIVSKVNKAEEVNSDAATVKAVVQEEKSDESVASLTSSLRRNIVGLTSRSGSRGTSEVEIEGLLKSELEIETEKNNLELAKKQEEEERLKQEEEQRRIEIEEQDRKQKELEKFHWPTSSETISSRYRTSRRPKHTGLDISVNSGSPIFSWTEGTVIFAGWNGNYGYQVKIQHENGIVTAYAHNSKLLVNEGEWVEAGQTIAKSGSTGNSTGPHLHIEFIVDGSFVDPLVYLENLK